MADSIRNDKQGKLEADTDVVACWPGGAYCTVKTRPLNHLFMGDIWSD